MNEIDIEDNAGRSALYLIYDAGHQRVVEAVVAKEADVNLPRNEGSTPLMAATVLRHIQVVKYLLLSVEVLNHINHQNNAGQSAFYLTCHQSHREVAEALSAGGANVNRYSREDFVDGSQLSCSP